MTSGKDNFAKNGFVFRILVSLIGLIGIVAGWAYSALRDDVDRNTSAVDEVKSVIIPGLSIALERRMWADSMILKRLSDIQEDVDSINIRLERISR